MKLSRYRKPSLKAVTGLTEAKKRTKKAAGITAAAKPLRKPSNLQRQTKRKVGYYSGPAKLVRNKKAPTPLGCSFSVVLLVVVLLGLAAFVL